MGHGLVHGPLRAGAAHLCIDMQRLFAPDGPWPAPWSERILPRVEDLAARAAQRSLFTRFIPPRDAVALPGTWQAYYRKWPQITRERIDPRPLDLVPDLGRFTPPAWVIDKTRYSAFSAPNLMASLARLRADTLILSGAETDVCVLATLFDAVDHGFRVVLAADAVCSSSDTGHDAVLSMLHSRLSLQVEVAETAEILDAWQALAAV